MYKLLLYIIFPLIEAGSLIQARDLTAFVPKQPGSQIQAGSPIEAESNGKYHRANSIGHRTVVQCILCDVLRYLLVGLCGYGIRKFRKRKSCTLKLEIRNRSNRWF